LNSESLQSLGLLNPYINRSGEPDDFLSYGVRDLLRRPAHFRPDNLECPAALEVEVSVWLTISAGRK